MKTNKRSNESQYYYARSYKKKNNNSIYLILFLVIDLTITSLFIFLLKTELIMQNAAASNTTADNLAVLIDMGFSEEQSKEALHRVENLEDAIAFLLNDQVQPSPPSSPGVSQADTSDDEASYAANPRCMQFIINTGHPQLSFSACLLNIAQASFDLYDQIMAHRSQLLSFKSWHQHGELKQLFECNNSEQLRELNHQFEIALEEDQICTALITDAKHQQPVCLAVFGIASYLEQYTSQFKPMTICPAKFFLNNDDDDENISKQGNINEPSRKQ